MKTQPELQEVEQLRDPKNIYQRIATAAATIDKIIKEKPREGGISYKIVSHDAVTSAVRGPLLDAGVIYFPRDLVQMTEAVTLVFGRGSDAREVPAWKTNVTLNVRFQNIDDPEDFLDVPAIATGIDQGDKGPGKAVSYAVKYALLKGLMLETGDDADHEAVEAKPAPRPAQAPRPAEAPRGDYACTGCGTVHEHVAPLIATKPTGKIQPGDLIVKCAECAGKWMKVSIPTKYADPFAKDDPNDTAF